MNQVYTGYQESFRVIQVPMREAGSLFKLVLNFLSDTSLGLILL